MLSKIIEFFLITLPLYGWLFFQGSDSLTGCLGILVYYVYAVTIIHFYFSSIQSKNKELLKKFTQKNNECLQEIEHEKALKRKLRKSATHDPLTGLPNRLLLKDRLNQTILRSKRGGEIFGLLFMDLDRFKLINDTYGHEIGDKILRATALRLKKSLREEDTIARIGGDEFVVLIPHLTHEKDVYPIAEKVIQKLSAPYRIKKLSLLCPVSIGIAVFPTGGLTPSELLRNADTAMYQAKNNGGERFSFYSPQ